MKEIWKIWNWVSGEGQGGSRSPIADGETQEILSASQLCSWLPLPSNKAMKNVFLASPYTLPPFPTAQTCYLYSNLLPLAKMPQEFFPLLIWNFQGQSSSTSKRLSAHDLAFLPALFKKGHNGAYLLSTSKFFLFRRKFLFKKIETFQSQLFYPFPQNPSKLSTPFIHHLKNYFPSTLQGMFWLQSLLQST